MREIIVFGRECSAHLTSIEKFTKWKTELQEIIDNDPGRFPSMTAFIDEDEVLIKGERRSLIDTDAEGQHNLLLDTPPDYTRYDSHIEALVSTTKGHYSKSYRDLIVSSPEEMDGDHEKYPSYFFDVDTGEAHTLKSYLEWAKSVSSHDYARIQIVGIATYKID